MKFGFTPEAEILNARLAMLGFVIAVGTYMTTGQIIPGVWWFIGSQWDPIFLGRNTLVLRLDGFLTLCYNK